MDLRQAPGAIALQSSPGVDVWSGWGSAVLVTAVSVLVLALIGIVIWQIFKTAQTRMTTQAIIAQDEQFRRLAERAAESQATIAVETARISAELQEISVRIAAMERMLRDVG
jgi:hypothetical protein